MNKVNDKEAIDLFEKGKVGIFPTDTAVGVGCRFDNEEAVMRVYELRNRPHEKALIALVSSIEMVEEYVEVSPDVRTKLINKYWPGGLTIILPVKKEKVLPVVRANGDTLAVRLPDHKVLQKIIAKLGVPIVAPSANISGGETPFTLNQVDKQLVEKVDFVLHGVCTMKGVSTIIDCTSMPWKIIREGAVTIDENNF